MRLFILLLFTPLFGIAQNQNDAQKNCEAWIMPRIQEDTNTYKSILFNDLDSITSISEAGVAKIKTLKYEKYELLNNGISSKVSQKQYASDFNTLRLKIIQAIKSNSELTGYKLIHKFTTKDVEGYLVEYKVKYELNLGLEVLETSISRNVDRASSDY
ncbi:MAG: hypothetical protein ACI9J3_001620 [Parvicellaceae bacterium]|jgi:hypothetical protein